MYVTIARHQFCHNNFNQNCLQDTIDTVAICVLIDKMIKNTSSALAAVMFWKKDIELVLIIICRSIHRKKVSSIKSYCLV